MFKEKSLSPLIDPSRLSPESTLPTPEGVPVNIKSPIFNVKYLETYDICLLYTSPSPRD